MYVLILYAFTSKSTIFYGINVMYTHFLMACFRIVLPIFVWGGGGERGGDQRVVEWNKMVIIKGYLLIIKALI